MCQACSLEWPTKMDKVLISMKTLRNITLEWIFCLLQPLSSQIHLRSKISTFRQSKSRKKLDHLVCTNFICLFFFNSIHVYWIFLLFFQQILMVVKMVMQSKQMKMSRMRTIWMILVKNPSSWWILVSTSLILQQAATTVIGEQEIIIPLEPEITIPEVAASLLFPILPDQTILVSPVMEKDQLILGRVRVPETGHVRVTETQVLLGTHRFNNLALIVILQLHKMAAWKAIQAKINKSTKFPLILTDDLCNIITTIHTIWNAICQLFVYIWS